jgi:hypothetical protein
MTDRRAFSRIPGSDLPWLRAWTVRSAVARVLDISDAGALIETPIRLNPGEREVVLLGGRHTIRIVGLAQRVEITRLAPFVSYRAAIRFATQVALGALGSIPEPTPEADVLTGETRELVERFARWVRELSGVHALRVSASSVNQPGTEAVNFAVPTSDYGNGRMLQVFFSQGAVPTADEFAHLRRLALLASDVPDLHIAPASASEKRIPEPFSLI